MIAYAVLMWAIAALFLLFGLLIYHGKTGLIHEYHRERVRSEDMAAYGRAFSTGLFALAGTLVLSGIVSLLWTLPGAVTASLVVLFVGVAASFAILWRVQRRYNGGML